MGFNIVIPTHRPHFTYNINFLNSALEYCIDKEDLVINFIVCQSDYEYFTSLIVKYIELKINVFTLSDLIFLVDNIKVNDDISSFTTKYQYQSIKKLYSHIIIEGEDYIVFDSENICLKPFKICDIFHSQTTKPLLCSDQILHPIQRNVIDNCNNILNDGNEKWFFIKSYWYYEKQHVKNLIDDIKNSNGECFTLLKNNLFFEYQLYCQYIVKNNIKDVESVDNINSDISKILSNVNLNFEYVCRSLNDNNIDEYCVFLKRADERIVRLHWMGDNIKNKIIESTDVSIGTFHWD